MLLRTKLKPHALTCAGASCELRSANDRMASFAAVTAELERIAAILISPSIRKGNAQIGGPLSGTNRKTFARSELYWF
jgi:hypothetical protein